MDTKADQYLRKAEEAEELARTSLDQAAAGLWRDAAKVWREMVEKERGLAQGRSVPHPDKPDNQEALNEEDGSASDTP
jgi:hypothetical protein